MKNIDKLSFSKGSTIVDVLQSSYDEDKYDEGYLIKFSDGSAILIVSKPEIDGSHLEIDWIPNLEKENNLFTFLKSIK